MDRFPRAFLLIAWTAIGVGLCQAICSAIGGNANEAAPTLLLISGVMSVSFGALGLMHLKFLVRRGKMNPRALPFCLLYWFYPVSGTFLLVLALVTGIHRTFIWVAVVMQAAGLLLMSGWFRAAFRFFAK